MTEIRIFSKRASEIWPFRNSVLYLDSFLLFLFRWLHEHNNSTLQEDIPVWLNNAINAFVTPEMFRKGAPGFAELCEKNMDHVNRVVRKHMQKTLTDLVTDLRMNFAARQLTLTNVPIKIICHDSGITNLGHFYKAFKSVYHQTPSQYRESGQTIV